MKNKLPALALVTVIICVFLTGCTENNNNVVQFPHLDYSNSDYGFGINVPEGWTIDESGLMGSIVIFYGPVKHNFTVNIVINSDQLPSGITFDDYMEEALLQFENLFTNFQLISRELSTINNMDSYEIVYTYDQGLFSLKQNQVIIQNNSKLLLLTYSATILSYDDHVSEFQQSVNSLEIA
jgi:hypothetical protein